MGDSNYLVSGGCGCGGGFVMRWIKSAKRSACQGYIVAMFVPVLLVGS
jgi:hypothetical protein